MLLDDLAIRGAGPGAEREPAADGNNLEQLYGILIPAMQLQAAVDRLAILTQLRDLMRRPEDRMIVQGAVATFASSAAEVGRVTSARLSRSGDNGGNAEAAAHVEQLRGLVARVNHMLNGCAPGH